jgi:hypothetical protein
MDEKIPLSSIKCTKSQKPALLFRRDRRSARAQRRVSLITRSFFVHGTRIRVSATGRGSRMLVRFSGTQIATPFLFHGPQITRIPFSFTGRRSRGSPSLSRDADHADPLPFHRPQITRIPFPFTGRRSRGSLSLLRDVDGADPPPSGKTAVLEDQRSASRLKRSARSASRKPREHPRNRATEQPASRPSPIGRDADQRFESLASARAASRWVSSAAPNSVDAIR